MGRPPTRSAIPYEVLENLNAYMLGNVQACDGMPYDSDVRAMIIAALMERLKALKPTVHQHCLKAIATIANLEAARFVPRERIDHEIVIELQRIMNGKVSRVTHLPEILHQQRGALIDYFVREKYPIRTRNSIKRNEWIKDRWPRMMEFLAVMRCPCGHYNTSLADFETHVRQYERRREIPRGTGLRSCANAADLILSNLHATTIENVRNQLKPSA